MKRFLLLAGCCCLLGSSYTTHAQLFSDNFTRGSDPGPLTPWVNQAGVWTVTGGAFRAGTNGLFSYGYANITNVWTNYTVQARIRFQAEAFGGGLGGRLNPVTGSHYAAWIYPDNSTAVPNRLSLIKFQTYTTFTTIANVDLAPVGTNFHTVRLDFNGNQIAVFLDGVQRINTNDTDTVTFTNGAVSLGMWTDSVGYLMHVDDVLVNGMALTANSDTFNATTGLLLSVPPPGVLGNDTGGNGPLNASLVTGPIRGTFSLSSNGGFNYTATNNYVGNDTFTYRANDGVTNSSATVTITVSANHAPVAVGDSYSVLINSSLSVVAPGVLANDSDVDGNSLTAQPVTGPTFGTLTLTNNGGFRYTPNPGFTGNDSFTYRANDGSTNSTAATVILSVLPPALFSDDFTRGTEPGPIDPWINQAGNWSVSSGVLRGGTNNLFNYGFAYITNNWTNYSVQARFQFPVGAFGGGLGGRLNPATGTHYAAWIYPDDSPATPNTLRLIKFSNFGNFTPVQDVALSSVGTNYHTLKLAFVGTRIAVYLDGLLRMSVTDGDAQTYTNGGVSFDFWTDGVPYVFSVDDLIVNKLAADNSYTVNGNATNSIAAPGLIGDDTGVYSTNLSASLGVGPTNGAATVNSNGSFTYTPNPGYIGPDTFTYSASDGTANLGTGTVSLSVIVLNTAPTLPAQTNRTIVELTSLTVTNTATDNDLPANTLTYSLLTGPTGGVISSNGIITWTPTEAQGPSSNLFTTRVVDNGTPPLSATNSFSVIVTETNTAPTLPNVADRTINELALMTVNNSATDPDLPANTLTYSFLSAPAGATISAGGTINWTPTEAQGPNTNIFTVRVVDNGSPAQSDTNSFTVVVNEVNAAPVLPGQTNRTIPAETTLIVTNTASDADTPVNTLTYTLLAGPANADISSSGVITWTPTIEQNNSTNLFRTRVVDNGAPVLSATNTFTILVNSNPVVILDSSLLVLEGCTPTNNAIDPGENVTMTFAFRNIGTGPATNLNVTVLETNGIVSTSGTQTYGVLNNGGAVLAQSFTFANTGACGGTITASLQIKDGAGLIGTTNLVLNLGIPSIIYTQNFDSVTAPALPSAWSTSAGGAISNWVTVQTGTNHTPPNAVFSTAPAAVGSNELISSSILLPPGPSQLTFRNFFDLENQNTVTGYDGGVLEIQIGTNAFVDILAAGGSFASGGYTHTISTGFQNPLGGRQAWSGVSAGFISTVVNLPAAAQGANVAFRWRCGTDSGVGRPGWRIDTIGIIARTCCANTAPVLGSISNQTISETSTLTVTNTAADSSTPPAGLTYSLVNPPTGAAISPDGVITWTPSETQGPSIATITTIVSDNSVPPLSATNSFLVTVTELNSAPTLPSQPNLTIQESTLIIVTNTASDPDAPANGLSYLLIDAPSGALIDGAGVISWIPGSAQAPSTNLFTTVATDDGVPALSATNSFLVVVLTVNSAPVLPPQPDRTVAELTLLTVTNTAADSDLPPDTLTYQLLGAPPGAVINPNGVITWTPTEAQGPITNIITTVVSDNGSPPLHATNSFAVIVTEVNSAPSLSPQTDHTIAELTTLSVTNAAIDSDSPWNIVSYALLDPPAGATVNTNGVISWTPLENQGPGTYMITTVASDDGTPSLHVTNSFSVVVTEVNSAPVLSPQSDHTIAELTALSVTNAAIDSDSPANTISYVLVNPPAGATINANGVITWTPSENQGPNTYVITTVASDNGTPALHATNSFTVVVTEANSAPVLPAQANRTINVLTTLTVTNTATDSDSPANVLAYSLVDPPSGATIDPAGIITWTPSILQASTTNLITTIVADNGSPSLTATNSFIVVVRVLDAPPPVIESVLVENGQAVVRWTAVSGRSYMLHFVNSLEATNWTGVLPPIIATGSTASATNALSGAQQRFYRVQLLP